jgi:hypothetical protein
MSRRGRVEFYQFDTRSRYIGTTTEFGRREKAIRLLVPKLIEKGQKRRHLRIRPVGQYAFEVDIIQPHFPDNPIPLHGFTRLHRAAVYDLSLGGMQVSMQARPGEIKVQPGQTAYVHFKPPMGDLLVEDIPRNFFAKVKIITIFREETGRRVMTNEADENTIGIHQIRLQFVGKGTINNKDKNVAFRPATTLAFEDLGRWIQAYQRHRIQEQKGTAAKPSRVRNVYAARKPDVKQKYPPQPLKRDVEE